MGPKNLKGTPKQRLYVETTQKRPKPKHTAFSNGEMLHNMAQGASKPFHTCFNAFARSSTNTWIG